jgi:hypothetical protein
MNRVKLQENGSTLYDRKIRKRLRTIVLSTNVNDYDTGEDIILYKKNAHKNDHDIFV